MLNYVEIGLGENIARMLKEHDEAVVLDRVYRAFRAEDDRSLVIRMYKVHEIKNGENLDTPEAEVVILMGNDDDEDDQGPLIKIIAHEVHTLRVLSAISTFVLNDLSFLMSQEFEDK